mgnify:CR=1 FL=1
MRMGDMNAPREANMAVEVEFLDELFQARLLRTTANQKDDEADRALAQPLSRPQQEIQAFIGIV